MTKKNFSIEKSLQAIETIDFSMIIDKMHHTYGWSKEHLDKICRLYRNFLILSVKNSKLIVPSKEIDEFWHNHILDTKKYIKDCNQIFGKYWHHYPYLGLDKDTDLSSLQDIFAETQRLYHEEFGEYIYDVIPTGWRSVALNIVEFIEKSASFAKNIFKKSSS